MIKASGVTLLYFTYTNYKGETERRRARPIGFVFGPSKWHPEPQCLMFAFDLDKMAERYFAVKDMKEVIEA